MSEQHSNLLEKLPPMTRKEVYEALGMTRTTFWRDTSCLNLPDKKIVHDDLVRICEHLRRDIRLLENYCKKYII